MLSVYCVGRCLFCDWVVLCLRCVCACVVFVLALCCACVVFVFALCVWFGGVSVRLFFCLGRFFISFTECSVVVLLSSPWYFKQ